MRDIKNNETIQMIRPLLQDSWWADDVVRCFTPAIQQVSSVNSSRLRWTHFPFSSRTRPPRHPYIACTYYSARETRRECAKYAPRKSIVALCRCVRHQQTPPSLTAWLRPSISVRQTDGASHRQKGLKKKDINGRLIVVNREAGRSMLPLCCASHA